MRQEEGERRAKALESWGRRELGTTFSAAARFVPVSDDASFRRYFRLVEGQRQVVLVDAPPPQEDSAPFVHVAGLLRAQGVRAPEILAADLDAGFMAVTDFGDDVLLARLDPDDAPAAAPLYGRALDMLVRINGIPLDLPAVRALPRYDEALLRVEMNLFPEWFVERQLDYTLDAAEVTLIEDVFAVLVESALAQPQVVVHRDYHSRNLMLVEGEDEPGVLDFQDAVVGGLTYDAVSLLKDCYIRWPRAQVLAWLSDWRRRLMTAGHELPDPDQLVRWFDLMGLQRHIKVAGIFCRLNLRDGKPGYLHDVPRVLEYIREVTGIYAEFEAFDAWLAAVVMPRVAGQGAFHP